MLKSWHDTAWEDYIFWQKQDKRTLGKINSFLKDIERNGYNGIGKPEPLKGNLSGWWSVKIDDVNRLVFQMKDQQLEIYSCRGHYDD
jgi:toxin YoeB